MFRTLRRIFLPILSLAVVFSAAACGQKSASSSMLPASAAVSAPSVSAAASASSAPSGSAASRSSGTSSAAVSSSASSEDLSKGTQFRSGKLFEQHYQKHVVEQAEFGDITREQYLALAQQLVDSPGAQVLTKRDSGGDTLFYDPDTNEFAVKSADGYLRTFFRPSGGQSYYDRQT